MQTLTPAARTWLLTTAVKKAIMDYRLGPKPNDIRINGIKS